MLRADAATSRVLWRIDNMAGMLREPGRFPRIMVSPEFTAMGDEDEDGFSGKACMVGRMKLFSLGSDQSRLDGNCSFYLRCLSGVTVRFAVDVNGEIKDTFECEYEKQRDKGKHDFCKLVDHLEPDGSVTIGIEIRSVTRIK